MEILEGLTQDLSDTFNWKRDTSSKVTERNSDNNGVTDARELTGKVKGYMSDNIWLLN